MRVLDLFSGLGGFSQAFKDRGHEVVTVDIETAFEPTILADISKLTVADIEAITGSTRFDVVLASPPCTHFSIASCSHHWRKVGDTFMSRHPGAEFSLILAEKARALCEALGAPFIIENPRGLLRKMAPLKGLTRTTIWYCQYGETRAKPTDLWLGGGAESLLMFRPECKNGSSDHERSPRGSRTGTQGLKDAAARSVVAYGLSESICLQLEDALVRLGGA